MSPSSPRKPGSTTVRAAAHRAFVIVEASVRDERLRRQWTLRELAGRAKLSAAAVQSIEAGNAGSVEAYTRLADALGLRLEVDLVDPRRRAGPSARLGDLVHGAMGELEAGHLRLLGFPMALDEPYQHYQFAGRADLVAWDIAQRALLHIENRTRFPDIQEMAGAFNAKRAYLGRVLADRFGVRSWASETHVIVALWSAEILHSLRLRTASFRAICPDTPAFFVDWWTGTPPPAGRASTLVVLDPLAVGRQRLSVGLDEALLTRPRHRGYPDVVEALLRVA